MPANNIPTVLVIYGATGDLMAKKITPALFNLYKKSKLPKLFRVIGVGRRNLTRDEFHAHITSILKESDDYKMNKTDSQRFLSFFYYHKGRFENRADYDTLAHELGHIDGEWKVCSNKLFYTAVPPQYYEEIFRNLHNSGLTIPCGPDEGWTRVLVEKPFGKDATTAEKLDLLLAKLFKEEQIYRIDHYLAKEMLQNILSFRFSNNLMEQAWNNKYIEKIEIRLLEKLGVEKRGVFYDGLGALRDVGQNHLLQMLAFITMEHPISFTADAVRSNRAKLLQTLIPPSSSEVVTHTMRAQYRGYGGIDGVKRGSKTETYFKVQGYLDSSRWRGVPFTLESGKRIKKQAKDIVVTFKHTTPCLCPPGGAHFKDTVTFSLEPKEGIEIQFLSKKPGLEMQVERRVMDFTYRKRKTITQYVEEYEKLLLDCIEGNQILFLSTDEVKAMWKFIDPIVSAWEQNKVPLQGYKPNTEMLMHLDVHSPDKITRMMQKEVVMIGLGKMGANAARNLIEKNWRVYGWNRTQTVAEAMVSEGLLPLIHFDELQKLKTPRVFWLMLNAGKPTDDVLAQLSPHLAKGDIVIDAANSNYLDTVRRHKQFMKKSIKFIDIGFSGGPGGARNGASLMVGGTKEIFDYIQPLLVDLAVPGGVTFFKGVGAGHFVKMVHNGIEYGMMQALAEGFDVLHSSKYGLNLKDIAECYNHGSVVESRLTNWLENAFRMYGNDLATISGSAGTGGGGAGTRIPGEADWTIDEANRLAIPAKVIHDAITARIASEKKPSFQGKVINALRNQFGGHALK